MGTVVCILELSAAIQAAGGFVQLQGDVLYLVLLMRYLEPGTEVPRLQAGVPLK